MDGHRVGGRLTEVSVAHVTTAAPSFFPERNHQSAECRRYSGNLVKQVPEDPRACLGARTPFT